MFTQSLPTLQFVWDSTSLGLLKECPRKYQYTILQQTVTSAFAVHLSFGIAYHKALEIFDLAKARGETHDSAVLEAVLHCMHFGERRETMAWEPEIQEDVLKDCFFPWDREATRNPNKHRETLIRSVIWYCEHFADDPCSTHILANGKPAVELSFKILLDFNSPDDQPYILAGHLDRLVNFESSLWYLDRKTTTHQLGSSYFAQYTPNNQMSIYDFASKTLFDAPAKGGIIDAAQILVGGTRFSRDFVTRSPSQIEEWKDDLRFYITQAEYFARNNYWPMNDKSCGNYGGCPFQPICGKDPSIRSAFLAGGGFKKHIWNPLENRGDV